MKGKALIWIAGAVFSGVFFINLCAIIFQCGCTYLWAGADTHCNIHMEGMKHCPWCAIGLGGGGLVYLGMIVPQAWVAFRRPASWKSLLLTLLMFPAAGVVLALILGVVQGYWS